MKRFILALLFAACANNQPPPKAETPVAPVTANAGDPCDARVDAAMDRMAAIHDAYFASVNRVGWTAPDCKAVEADLRTAAPAAATFSADLKAFERETRADEQCGRAIVDASNRDPRSDAIAQQFKAMLDASTPADERCSERVAGWRSLYDGVVGAVGVAM